MFRYKPKKKLTPEQLIARPAFAGSDANTKLNAAGSYGFTAGVSLGAALGAAIGTMLSVLGLGIPAPIVIPVCIVIGVILGGGGGILLGRSAGRKLEIVSIEEQKEKFGDLARDILAQKTVEDVITKEIELIKEFISLLYKYDVVTNTKSSFFNQVDDAIFTDTQKQLYNTMLDVHVLEQQMALNRNHIALWTDVTKVATLFRDIEKEILEHKMKVSSLTTLYTYEKKRPLLFPDEKNVRKIEQKHPELSGKSNGHLNHLIVSTLWGKPIPQKDIEKNIRNLNDRYTNMSPKFNGYLVEGKPIVCDEKYKINNQRVLLESKEEKVDTELDNMLSPSSLCVHHFDDEVFPRTHYKDRMEQKHGLDLRDLFHRTDSLSSMRVQIDDDLEERQPVHWHIPPR